MKRGLSLIFGSCILAISARAQSLNDKKTLPASPAQASASKAGRQDVEKLCGCYEVEFKYAETFSPDTGYKFHDRDEINGGLEWITPIEVSDKKIVLQHLLVITDSMIIKHWREDWTFENPTLFRYQGNKVWKKEQLKPEEVKSKWTQSVWEVSDAPRYQGASDWIHTDGKVFWQSTSDAPLPRREYTIRNDYNILRRTNRITLTGEGWVHEQDNQKIVRKNGTDKLLVEEKGINSYKKVEDSKCATAKAFWEKNKVYWSKVRAAWDDYIASHNFIELKTMVDGKALHENLDALSKEFAGGKIKAGELDARIKASLEKYMGHDLTVAQNQ